MANAASTLQPGDRRTEYSSTVVIIVNRGLQKECQEVEKSSTMLTLLSLGKHLKVRDHHQFSSHRTGVNKGRKKGKEIKKKCALFLLMVPIL